MLPCFGKFWVVFWEHYNINGSITSFLTLCSHLLIMLQIKFSCSHILMRFDAKFWEHEKTIGSITKMWEHHITICIMLPDFLSCSHVLGVFWSKSGSMSENRPNIWEHEPKFGSTSNFFGSIAQFVWLWMEFWEHKITLTKHVIYRCPIYWQIEFYYRCFSTNVWRKLSCKRYNKFNTSLPLWFFCRVLCCCVLRWVVLSRGLLSCAVVRCAPWLLPSPSP